MTQPTLAHIPSILLRTGLRVVARLVLIVALLVTLIGLSLGLFSLLLATWRTPRSRKTQLAADIILLATELAKDRRRVTQTDSH